ncbi:MAG: thioesterase family protein [Propionibacteriaceae bacterium]|jgi:acyl-CoA thioester hydrolase|nr:thioesterase family protein [Propionibacteriaceae bacterium]
MSFHATVQRRWTDLDAQGHANNTAFAEYFQEARTQFICSGSAAGMLVDGYVVVENQVEFARSIPYSAEPLRVEVVVSELGAARFVLAMQLYDGPHLAARSRNTCCPYDFETRLPRRLSDAERSGLEADFVSTSPFREMPSANLHGEGERYEFYPRWSDLDSYGHINNVRFFDFIQEARIAAMTTASGKMARIGTSSWGEGEMPTEYITWLLARQDVKYITQLSHRLTPYVLVTAPIKVGVSSITYQAEVIDPEAGNAVLARAQSVVVSADQRGTPQALPDDMRMALEERLVTPE